MLVSPQKSQKTAAIPSERAVWFSGSETVLPTVIITGTDGAVLWTHLTDNYRIRPEPSTFLEVLSANGF